MNVLEQQLTSPNSDKIFKTSVSSELNISEGNSSELKRKIQTQVITYSFFLLKV